MYKIEFESLGQLPGIYEKLKGVYASQLSLKTKWLEDAGVEYTLSEGDFPETIIDIEQAFFSPEAPAENWVLFEKCPNINIAWCAKRACEAVNPPEVVAE